jgi:hypothetical protein
MVRSAGSCEFIWAAIKMAEQSKQPERLLEISARLKARSPHLYQKSSVDGELERHELYLAIMLANGSSRASAARISL